MIRAPGAAAACALGLHALQHRGQEAVGITSFDGAEFCSRRGTGHVADNFSSGESIAELPGTMAAGHVRYSTTGGAGLRNVQPLFAELATGGFAIAHNGNISNAMTLKRELVRQGAIFQSTSDTEVIIHLVATSRRYPTVLDRLIDALRQVEGAYSLICMTPQGMIACRDPLGIRPLVMGKLGDATVFASETVALDVVGADFVRQIEPGEIVEVNLDGVISSTRPFGDNPSRPCIFEHVYFSRPDSVFDGRSVYASRKAIGTQLAIEAPCEADIVVPVPDSGVPAAIGFAEQSGIPFELGIIRSHYVGRTFIQPSDSVRHSERAPQAQRQPQDRRRQAHRADRRFDRARHHQHEDRADDARCRRQRSAFPRRQPADRARLLLRRRHARAHQAARPRGWTSRRCASSSRPTASRSFRSTGSIARSGSKAATPAARNIAMPASPATIRPA